MILTLAVTPTDPPSGLTWRTLIWAWMHKPTFYPLTALLVAGPILSLLAWQTPGRHRTILVLAWIVFLSVLFGVFGERAVVMLRVLWWKIAG